MKVRTSKKAFGIGFGMGAAYVFLAAVLLLSIPIEGGVSLLDAAAMAQGSQAQSLPPSPSPAPKESPVPAYFGFYAVSNEKLTSLMLEKLVYVGDSRGGVLGVRNVPKESFDPTSYFLNFEPKAGEAVGLLELWKLKYLDRFQPPASPLDILARSPAPTYRADLWVPEQRVPAAWAPTERPDLIRFVPSSRLQNGVYAILRADVPQLTQLVGPLARLEVEGQGLSAFVFSVGAPVAARPSAPPSAAAPVPSPPSSITPPCSDTAACLKRAVGYLARGEYQHAGAMWDSALRLGGQVSVPACHEHTLSCDKGIFSLGGDEISFTNEKGEKELSARPADVTPITVQQRLRRSSAFFRLRAGNRNYNFTYAPEGLRCDQTALGIVCPDPGLQQQLTVGNWVVATIPKLASGGFAAPPPTSDVAPPPGADIARQPVVPGGKIGQFRHGTLVTRLPSGSLVAVPTPQDATHTHAGVDIAAECGAPIHAVADGTVVDAIADDGAANFDSIGYMVIVRHSQPIDGKDTFSAYFHMREAPEVRVNDEVIAGQTRIGVVGDTGVAAGCHLHLEVRHFQSRFLENRDWNVPFNIYGLGDQRNSAVFLENWENPENLRLELR